MDILSSLGGGFGVALQPLNLVLALVGCFLGTVIGALPGIGPVNGIAILIPLAFSLKLSPVESMILLTSVYYGTMFGGRISSILLNIPGDAPAVMTCLDGYPMALKGRAADALAISAISSFAGGTLATIGLTICAPLLAKAAIYFGPPEYFALFVLAVVAVGGVGTGNPAKTLIAGMLGLALSTVGIDPASGVPRFTFDSFELFDGIDFVVAAIGLFAISEFLMFLTEKDGGQAKRLPVGQIRSSFRDLIFPAATLRSSALGFVIGVLPGAGATMASFLGYTLEKKVSDKDGTFGKGDPRGVAAPEAADNAAAGGNLVPMLTLGIPGSGATAIMLGMLVTLNIQPGPLLFERQPELIWGLVAALYVSNFILLVLNIPLVGIFARLLTIPTRYLMPIVVVISYVGVYSISNSAFDLLLMTLFGVLGYAMRKMGFSMIPLVLGMLLGGPMEQNLRRAMQASGGEWSILVQSPLSIGLHAVTIAMVAAAIAFELRSRRRVRAAANP
ncbi:tripartite tricarboxylate transporter permease [Stella sp.]|uniref:tripartite tricarboxylate transporter permease n=1 Tax=Stella sp. TaxID=2912054 RepID=UPI0035AE51FB